MTGFRYYKSQVSALNYQKQGGCNYQTEGQDGWASNIDISQNMQFLIIKNE